MCSTFGKRCDVILGEMSLSTPSTISTTVVEDRLQFDPFGCGEIVESGASLSRAPDGAFGAYFRRMPRTVCRIDGAALCRVCSSIGARAGQDVFAVPGVQCRMVRGMVRAVLGVSGTACGRAKTLFLARLLGIGGIAFGMASYAFGTMCSMVGGIIRASGFRIFVRHSRDLSSARLIRQ